MQGNKEFIQPDTNRPIKLYFCKETLIPGPKRPQAWHAVAKQWL